METKQFRLAQMGLFSGQYFHLLKAVPQNNLTPMRSCPEDASLVLFDHWVIRNLNAFTFDICIDSVTHFVGIARKYGHYDDS